MLTEAEVRAIKARAEASAPADDLTDANIVFLDNARTDMLALCDEVLRLQAAEQELQERLGLLDDLAAERQQMLLEVTVERDALRRESPSPEAVGEEAITEAEARAYVTELLAALHRDCREIGTHPVSCYCGGTGHIARDWHVWEDLRPAMEAAGCRWWTVQQKPKNIWVWIRYSPETKRWATGEDANPIIAAALALQQEESDD